MQKSYTKKVGMQSSYIGGQNPAKLDQTNEKVCIGLGGLGDSNF
jgi:hypothetical protein